MDPIVLAQQATNIILPALPFIYAGKDIVTDKVKDMLLEKGIEKLGSKFTETAKALFDKIRSKGSESIEIALKELSRNPADIKAKNELQQGILKLLTEDPNLAREIELTINFDVENINQFAVGDHNTLINFENPLILPTENSSKQKFKNCKFEGNVFGDYAHYTDNSKHTHISGNYCTYEGRKENDNIFSNIFLLILEKLAPIFISRYGKSKSMLIGFFIAICGCFVAFSSILFTDTISSSNTQNNTGYELQFLKLFLSYVLVSIGSIIFVSIIISDHTKCEMCGHGFGYKEIKRPLIEETYCTEGVVKKTTRYYKCRYCNYEKIVPFEKLIKPIDKSR